MEEKNNEEFNIDNLEDEDIDAILNDIESGAFDEESVEDTGEEDDNQDDINNSDEDLDENDLENDSDDDDSDNNDDNDDDNETIDDEDTDYTDDSENSSESDDESDGSSDDTADDDDDDDEENTLVDEDSENEDDDKSETKDENDGSNQDTEQINVDEFNKYKKFYDEVVNAEFTANGKKVKGFDDPKKIIQSQQMSYGFSDKMAGFKKYRPFMNPLKDSGMLEDEDKFNLMIDIANGDKEALKKHLKTLELDPVVDLDMENIDYSSKNHLASKTDIVIEDAIDQARQAGVEDKLRSIVGKEWDDASYKEFVSDSNVRRDLLNHLSTGAYDTIQEKISEFKRLDVDGSFGDMKSTDQYRYAVKALQQEYIANQAEKQNQEEAKINVESTTNVEAEKQRILDERKQSEYKAKAQKEKQKISEQRKKASSMSKKKRKAPVKKEFDPLALEDDDLDALVNDMIAGKFKN